MKRKIIKQGLGGYTIYLPKKWVSRKALQGGNEVDIVETDKGLLINSSIKERKNLIIKISETNKRDVKQLLSHAYRKGFDTINIKNVSPDVLKEVKDTVNKILLGFEITEKTETNIRIENISEPTGQKYEAISRRAFLIINETLELLIKDFEKNKLINKNEIQELRDQQDSLILFCKRILIQDKYEKEAILEWETLTFLMHIEHTLYYLYLYGVNKHFVKKDEMMDILKALKDYFGLYQNAYVMKDLALIHKINNQKTKYQFGKCLELLEKSRGKEAVAYSYIKDAFRYIQIGTSPMLAGFYDEQINQ